MPGCSEQKKPYDFPASVRSRPSTGTTSPSPPSRLLKTGAPSGPFSSATTSCCGRSRLTNESEPPFSTVMTGVAYVEYTAPGPATIADPVPVPGAGDGAPPPPITPPIVPSTSPGTRCTPPGRNATT
jgi:hypothetical protein